MYDYGFFSFESKADFLRRSEEFWNPDKTRFWQDAGVDLVIDRREGYLLLGHGGPPADRPAPQRRHLQPRPPQPRADRRRSSRRWAASTSATTTSRRSRAPRWPRRSSATCPPNMQRVIYGERRRRGDRHRDQDRAPHAPEAQDRLDPQGLPRPHRARGGGGRRPLLDAVPVRPPGRVRAGPVQRPRRDGGGAARRRRRRRGDRDDPRHLRLPAARARLPARGQGRCASATARSTSPTRCRPG